MLIVTLVCLNPNWSIITSDGRAWFTGYGNDQWTKAKLRKAYPKQCRKLREPGNTATFKDTKNFFTRTAARNRIWTAGNGRKG